MTSALAGLLSGALIGAGTALLLDAALDVVAALRRYRSRSRP